MNDEYSVTVVRAWSRGRNRPALLIRMINSHGRESRDRYFASVDEAVAQLREWLVEFERSHENRNGEPQAGGLTTRRRDDAPETDH